MRFVAIVFHSLSGTTERLAHEVATGCRRVGVEGKLMPVVGTQIQAGRFVDPEFLRTLDQATAIVFGAPTFMGGPSAQFKAVADATSDRWDQQKWSGKLAAGFTVGGCPNGDQGATLQYFSLLASQHGMLWLGLDIAASSDPFGRNRLGTQLGASAVAVGSEIEASDLATAAYLGERVARYVTKLASAT
jgi:multimeric flavodoxin WrbA